MFGNMIKRFLARMKFPVLGGVAVLLLLPGRAAYAETNMARLGIISGTVVETTNASLYTYVRVDTGTAKLWAAAPQFAVQVGDKVSFSDKMPMQNFQSKALHRTFELVYFTGGIDVAGTKQPAGTNEQAAAAAPKHDAHADLHGSAAKATQPSVVDLTGIQKAEGGLTVAEIHQRKNKLERKHVTFRGKVVKYNPQVMNRNWLHVRDGTGTSGANDVTVTTDDTAGVGDTVVVTGTVVLSQDYGYGYKYDLVVKDAKVKVEKQLQP
jgi:hypothetical protein